MIDRTVRLEVNGSTQQLRLCAERTGLSPILIVQAGPGIPLLHEVRRFQRQLRLEQDFLVGYWEQRGCGNASRQDAESVSLQRQVDDLRTVLQWFQHETRQAVIVFGISLGATLALQAVEHEVAPARSVIAISPDAHTTISDAAVYAWLQERGKDPGSRRLSGKVRKLGEPPYTDSAAFQLRASLLADLGAIERDKKFSALVSETLWGMIRTYAPVGTARAMRNMKLIQGKLLPQLVSLDLLANPPRLAIPVHYVFGEQDALTPATLVKRLPAAIAAPESTVTLVSDAGHMVHFDQPKMVRSIAVRAGGARSARQ